MQRQCGPLQVLGVTCLNQLLADFYAQGIVDSTIPLFRQCFIPVNTSTTPPTVATGSGDGGGITEESCVADYRAVTDIVCGSSWTADICCSSLKNTSAECLALMLNGVELAAKLASRLTQCQIPLPGTAAAPGGAPLGVGGAPAPAPGAGSGGGTYGTCVQMYQASTSSLCGFSVTAGLCCSMVGSLGADCQAAILQGPDTALASTLTSQLQQCGLTSYG
ncbi:hypothetical protein ABPG75_008838 [Micractinium tetrahymenae]